MPVYQQTSKRNDTRSRTSSTPAAPTAPSTATRWWRSSIRALVKLRGGALADQVGQQNVSNCRRREHPEVASIESGFRCWPAFLAWSPPALRAPLVLGSRRRCSPRRRSVCTGCAAPSGVLPLAHRVQPYRVLEPAQRHLAPVDKKQPLTSGQLPDDVSHHYLAGPRLGRDTRREDQGHVAVEP